MKKEKKQQLKQHTSSPFLFCGYFLPTEIGSSRKKSMRIRLHNTAFFLGQTVFAFLDLIQGPQHSFWRSLSKTRHYVERKNNRQFELRPGARA
jgi:hypothetical protein